MTWEMAERWVASGLAVLVSKDDRSIVVETRFGVRFTVWAKACEPQ